VNKKIVFFQGKKGGICMRRLIDTFYKGKKDICCGKNNAMQGVKE